MVLNDSLAIMLQYEQRDEAYMQPKQRHLYDISERIFPEVV